MKQMQACEGTFISRITLDDVTRHFLEQVTEFSQKRMGLNPSASTVMRRALAMYFAYIHGTMRELTAKEIDEFLKVEADNLRWAARKPADWS